MVPPPAIVQVRANRPEPEVGDLFAAQGGSKGLPHLAEENATISLGRPAQPDEVGTVVAFLAGPHAGYITGAALPVDGGMTFGL